MGRQFGLLGFGFCGLKLRGLKEVLSLAGVKT